MPWNYTLDCPQCHETYWSYSPEGVCESCQVPLVRRASKPANELSLIIPIKSPWLPLVINPGKKKESRQLFQAVYQQVSECEIGDFDPLHSWGDCAKFIQLFTNYSPAIPALLSVIRRSGLAPADVLILLEVIKLKEKNEA